MYEEFAAVYDRLMDDFDYPSWADYYLKLLSNHGVTPKLLCECGCGTGSMTIQLAKRGIKVIASDVSEDMLRIAQSKARKNGIITPFILQDMRSLSLHRPVDAVLCCCDGVNYLSSPDAVQDFFHAAYTSLRPGGAIAFDISSRFKLKEKMGDAFFGEERDDVAYLWQNRYDDKSECISMDLTFFLLRADGLYSRFCEQHEQRAHTKEELLRWLNECGFEDATAYGDRVFEAPSPSSERLHFIAKKPVGDKKQ